MAEFLTGNDLNAAMESIFRNAENILIIISPFIKLHDRYKSSLLNHLENDKLEIIVVFGKNEDNLIKSLSLEDLNFFKQFPNVEIKYEKRLHAKYYANESTAIITSMNLYSFSQDNNIEVGVLTEHTRFGNNALDNEAYNYFHEVIEQSKPIFKKTPHYESSLMGLKKNYDKSIVEFDNISELFTGKIERNFTVKNEFQQQKPPGYCIRTGVKIPFNIKMPLSPEAYKSWSKYGDKNYPEKFCHFSGELSNKETSFEKPILMKNLRKAHEIFGV